jgi:hypothetical protein
MIIIQLTLVLDYLCANLAASRPITVGEWIKGLVTKYKDNTKTRIFILFY